MSALHSIKSRQVIAFDVRVFRDVRGAYDPALPNPLLGMTSADFARLAAGVYAANGVREYWLVDHDKRAVKVFYLRGATYDPGATVASARVSIVTRRGY